MSIRNDQCKKVCKILDDALANRPSERDALIVAVQTAFKALTDDGWVPVEKALPNDHETYLLTHEIRNITGRCRNEVTMAYYDDENGDWLTDAESPEIISYPLAWQRPPKPYESKEDNKC